MELAERSSDSIALARELFAWFKDHDMESLFGVLHPDVRAQPSLDGAPVLNGRAAVIEWWQGYSQLGSDLEPRPLDFEVRGSCVIVRGYLRHRDGRMLSERQAFWLFAIADGQITRMESHPTRESALARCS